MISFDAEHRAVHYPSDRRFRIWIRPSIAIGVIAVVVSLNLGKGEGGKNEDDEYFD